MFCDQCHAEMEEAQPFCDKCGADKPTSGWGPDLLLGTVVAGRYRLEERLGSGGMGYVYRAEHTDLGTDFAVKFLHRDLTTPVHKKRFKREARVAASLRNPHAVQVVDFGELPNDDLYLVMEYVPGHNLSDWVDLHGHPSTAFVVTMVKHIATALEEAHEQGTVHRDIKPENILIAPTKRGVHVKLTDFGIASLIDNNQTARLTRTGMVHGSPGYMSPEQASGARDLDGRADLYALGVIAWELLADRPMFEAATPMALIVKHIHDSPISLRVHRPPPELPEPLYGVIERLLRKEPEKRTGSAEKLLAELADVPIDMASVRVPLSESRKLPPVEVDPNWDRTTEQSTPSLRPKSGRRELDATVAQKRFASNESQAQSIFSKGESGGVLAPPTKELSKLGSTPYGYEPVGGAEKGDAKVARAPGDLEEPRFETTERVDPRPLRAQANDADKSRPQGNNPATNNPTHEAPATLPPEAGRTASGGFASINVQPAPVRPTEPVKSNAFRKPTLSEEFPLEPIPAPPRRGRTLMLLGLLAAVGFVFWVLQGGGFAKLWLHPDAVEAKAERGATTTGDKGDEAKPGSESAGQPGQAPDAGVGEPGAAAGATSSPLVAGPERNLSAEGAGVRFEMTHRPARPQPGEAVAFHVALKQGDASLPIGSFELITKLVRGVEGATPAMSRTRQEVGEHPVEVAFHEAGGYQAQVKMTVGEEPRVVVARCDICVGDDDKLCEGLRSDCVVEAAPK